MSPHSRSSVHVEAVSVVVPTFERPDDLARRLASLGGQDAEGFEVLVVDNASDPSVQALVESHPRVSPVR